MVVHRTTAVIVFGSPTKFLVVRGLPDYHYFYPWQTMSTGNGKFLYMQHPILRTNQGTLHFTPWPIQSNTISTSLGNIQTFNPWRLFLHKYPPLSITRYSCIQLSELEQCRASELPCRVSNSHQHLLKSTVIITLPLADLSCSINMYVEKVKLHSHLGSHKVRWFHL